jgi:hypothetical protein
MDVSIQTCVRPLFWSPDNVRTCLLARSGCISGPWQTGIVRRMLSLLRVAFGWVALGFLIPEDLGSALDPEMGSPD